MFHIACKLFQFYNSKQILYYNKNTIPNRSYEVAVQVPLNMIIRDYQILMHPIVRADQYLLDTKTGQVWHLVEDQKDKFLIWEPMLKSNPSIEELTSSEEK